MIWITKQTFPLFSDSEGSAEIQISQNRFALLLCSFWSFPYQSSSSPFEKVLAFLKMHTGVFKKKKQKLKFLMLRRLGDYSSEDKWRQNMYAYIHQKTCTSLIPATQTVIVSNCKELKGLLPVEWVGKWPSHWTTHKMKINPLLYMQQHGWITPTN